MSFQLIGQVALQEMTTKFPEHLLHTEDKSNNNDNGSFDVVFLAVDSLRWFQDVNYYLCIYIRQIANLANERICCTSLTKGLSQVRPIGIMSLIGDSLSNFIGIRVIAVCQNNRLQSFLFSL